MVAVETLMPYISWTWPAISESYCQFWCTQLMISGGFPADRSFVDTVDELDSGNDVGELSEAA